MDKGRGSQLSLCIVAITVYFSSLFSHCDRSPCGSIQCHVMSDWTSALASHETEADTVSGRRVPWPNRRKTPSFHSHPAVLESIGSHHLRYFWQNYSFHAIQEFGVNSAYGSGHIEKKCVKCRPRLSRGISSSSSSFSFFSNDHKSDMPELHTYKQYNRWNFL